MNDMMESDLEACVVVMPRCVTTDEDQFCWQCRWLNTWGEGILYRRNGQNYELTTVPDILLARNILIDGEAAYMVQACELKDDDIWETLTGAPGTAFPVSVSPTELQTIEADMDGMAAMRHIGEILGEEYIYIHTRGSSNVQRFHVHIVDDLHLDVMLREQDKVYSVLNFTSTPGRSIP